jgi:hypothetical protein
MEHIIGIEKLNLNEDKNFEYILILKNNGLFNLYEIKNETKKMNEFNENIFEIDSLENMKILIMILIFLYQHLLFILKIMKIYYLLLLN